MLQDVQNRGSWKPKLIAGYSSSFRNSCISLLQCGFHHVSAEIFRAAKEAGLVETIRSLSRRRAKV